MGGARREKRTLNIFECQRSQAATWLNAFCINGLFWVVVYHPKFPATYCSGFVHHSANVTKNFGHDYWVTLYVLNDGMFYPQNQSTRPSMTSPLRADVY